MCRGLAAVVVLAGCDSAPGADRTEASVAVSSDRPPPPFAAELVEADGAEAAPGWPGPGLRLANVGSRPDTYLLRVLPPEAAAVVPAVVQVAPGAVVDVRLLPAPPGERASTSGPARLVVRSRGAGGQVAVLDLPTGPA